MGIGRPISMDKERVSFNLARLKKGGHTFEIVVEPDNAIAYKRGSDVAVSEVLRSENVFSDAKKGVLSPETELKAMFNSNDPLKVASVILKEGDIQLTTEYRDKLREEKKKRILYTIHRNAIDPKTKTPHPMVRLENAFEQAKCHIDEFKTAEEQVDEVVKKLRVILPLKIEELILQIHVPPQHSHQAYGVLKKMGEITHDSWGSDDSVTLTLQIPAGLQGDVMDKLNAMTHGGVDVKIIGETK